MVDEALFTKKATSRSDAMHTIFEVDNGEIIMLIEEDGRKKFHVDFINKTKNLLLTSSACSLFYEKFLPSAIVGYNNEYTGIKKLIQLFAYLNEMVEGGIVFIDEFDSNIHDVYLCALLEYLMEYGKGQLCFTTHNVGPMDVLKHHKKSIDFLSEDHEIYSWTTSGNYSPSKLYRNGMIEGSPFNIDSIDFIGIFGSGEEDE